jgi:uncharacterized protein
LDFRYHGVVWYNNLCNSYEALTAHCGEGIMNEQERIIAQRFADRIRESFPGSHSIVFGSKARGEGNLESDLDVLVLVTTDDMAAARETASYLAWETAFGTEMFISPIVHRLDSWQTEPLKSSLLAKNIAEDGITL